MTETMPSRLEEALSRYYELTEVGKDVDRGAMLLEYSDVAEQLQEFFDSEQLLLDYAGPTAMDAGLQTAMLGTSCAGASANTSVAPTIAEDLSAERIDAIPEKFGRYTIESCLGSGAMGAVFRAYDSKLDRHVAIKVPRVRLEAGSDAWDRFEREAQAAARLRHPNICAVHDVGEHEGLHYIAMAYVQGETLEERLKENGPLPIEEATSIVRKLADALASAHVQGVVHRDLKPANVMIDANGEPVITDFGLAVQYERPETRITQHGTIVGTPAYMAPEQIEGDPENHGPAVDVYALGIILYECLTGGVPFRGTITAVVSQAIGRQPEPPSSLRPEVDPHLDSACLRMLAKAPDDRFQSMDEVRAALDVNPLPIASTMRNSWIIAATLTSLCVAGLGIGYLTFGEQSAKNSDSGPADIPQQQPSNNVIATAERPQLIRRFEGKHKRVWCVAISPDGSLAASGSGREVPWKEGLTDGIVIWDFKTGDVLKRLPFNKANVRDIAFSPNGKRLLAARRQIGSLELWDVESGQSIRKFGESGGASVVFFNERFVVENTGRIVRVWDVEVGQLVASFPQSEGVAAIAVHPATRKLAIGLGPGVVRVLDLDDGSELHRFSVPPLKGKHASMKPVPKGLAFSPDGSRIAAGFFLSGTRCWEIGSGKKVYESKHYADAIAWMLNGRHFVAGVDGRWGLFDIADRKPTNVIPVELRIRDIAVAPDGRSLLLGGGPRFHHKDDRDFALQHWRLPEHLWPKSSPTQKKVDVPVAWTGEARVTRPAPEESKPAVEDHGKKVVELIAEAKTLMKRGSFNDASKRLGEAIRLDAKNAEAHFQRALCSLPFSNGENSHHRTGMRYLDASIRLDRENAVYVAKRAEYLQALAGRRGNDEKLRRRALADYTTAVKLKGDNDNWWFQKGVLHEGFAEREECDRAFRRAADLLQKKKNRNAVQTQRLAWCYLNNCNNLVQKGDIEAAMKMGDEAVAVAPRMVFAQLNRAIAYERHYDFKTALEAADLAIQAARGAIPAAFLLKARVFDTLGDLQSAHENASLALKVGNGPNAARAVSAYDSALGRHEIALYLLAKIREAVPNDAWAASSEGLTRARAGDFDGAIEAYGKALKFSDEPRFRVDRARLLRHLNRAKEAEQDEAQALAGFTQLIEQDKDVAAAIQARARLHWQRGWLDDSLADWESVVKRNPRDVYGLSHLSMLLASHPDAKRRDGKRALELAKRLIEIVFLEGHTKRAYFLSVRAATHAEKGQWNEALDWQRQALGAAPLTEYADYTERLELYNQRKPFRLDGTPDDPGEAFADVVVPDSIGVATLDALQPHAAMKQTPPQIAATQRSATVLVKSDEGFGTGMIVDRRGYVLTCAHILPYTGEVTIHYDDDTTQRTASAKPIAIDQRYDLALLHFDPPAGAALQTVQLGISDGTPVKVVTGSVAVVIGNPGEGDWVLQKSVLPGSITSDKQLVGDYVKRSYVQVGVNIAGGCSGGPVFDDHGRVIGVVVRRARTIDDTAFAVPMDRVIRFLGLAEETD